MTTKAKTEKMQPKTENVKMTFEQKLEAQIQHLEAESKKAQATYYQLVGSLNNAKAMLEEYKKEL